MANLAAKSSDLKEIWESLQDRCTTSVLALVALVFECGFDMDIGIGFGHFNVWKMMKRTMNWNQGSMHRLKKLIGLCHHLNYESILLALPQLNL